MKKISLRAMSATFLAAACALATVSVPVFPQSKQSNAVGDVLFTFVGQARFNPSTLVLPQYGYLTYANGVSGIEPIFNPGSERSHGAIYILQRHHRRAIDQQRPTTNIRSSRNDDHLS